MAHIHKKVKKGRAYYYVRETQRIQGKSTVISQVYLGSADKILSVFMGREDRVPKRFCSKEFGSLFLLHETDRAVDLARIVDEVVPGKRKTSGPSAGELLFYAAVNRAVAPKSKRRLRGWYEKTDIQHIRPVRLEALSPQNFWNHMDRIGEEGLDRIAGEFFRKVCALVPSDGGHFLFDTTNYYTYMDSRTPSALARRGHNKDGKHHLRQVGLALITERTSGIPVYYRIYPGNQHDARFFDLHLDEILSRVTSMGVSVRDLTLIFDKGMNSGSNMERIDAREDLHFITSYSPYFAPDLARIPLKRFQVLPRPGNQETAEDDEEEDRVLYVETTASLWGRERKVLVTFNPKTFRKKRYDLRDKIQKVRQELFELRRKHREGRPHWKDPESVRARYDLVCETLHVSPKLFQLSFYTENGAPAMAFQLNRYQAEAQLRRFAKTILVTDHHDWSPRDIYQAYMDRHVIENQFRRSKNPFHVALMPQYHWTDSKIRIHAFVCVVALTYLTLLHQQAKQAGIPLSLRRIMEEARSLRTAIFWMPDERKPRRILEDPTPSQVDLLQAVGFNIKHGRVPQHR